MPNVCSNCYYFVCLREDFWLEVISGFDFDLMYPCTVDMVLIIPASDGTPVSDLKTEWLIKRLSLFLIQLLKSCPTLFQCLVLNYFAHYSTVRAGSQSQNQFSCTIKIVLVSMLPETAQAVQDQQLK